MNKMPARAKKEDPLNDNNSYNIEPISVKQACCLGACLPKQVKRCWSNGQGGCQCKKKKKKKKKKKYNL